MQIRIITADLESVLVLLKGLLQLVVRVPYYYHTIIISIPKSVTEPVLPIVRDPLCIVSTQADHVRSVLSAFGA